MFVGKNEKFQVNHCLFFFWCQNARFVCVRESHILVNGTLFNGSFGQRQVSDAIQLEIGSSSVLYSNYMEFLPYLVNFYGLNSV